MSVEEIATTTIFHFPFVGIAAGVVIERAAALPGQRLRCAADRVLPRVHPWDRGFSGGSRLHKREHTGLLWLVALTAYLSVFWVMVAAGGVRSGDHRWFLMAGISSFAPSLRLGLATATG